MARKKSVVEPPVSPTPSADPAREPIIRHRFVQRLPVRVDGPALVTLAEGMATLFEELDIAETNRANDMREHKKTITGLKERMKEIAKGVRSHTEMRDVECVTRLMANNSIEDVRTDTGEILETRAADADDLQDDLPMQEIGPDGQMRDVAETEPAPAGDAAEGEPFPEPAGAIDDPQGVLAGEWTEGANPRPVSNLDA